MNYNGWMIPDTERARILALFPPRYPVLKASHITLSLGVHHELPQDASVEIIGHVDDETGVEALVVSVDGDYRRPDGSIFHITLSLGAGRTAKETNTVLAQKPFRRFGTAIPITTRAFCSEGRIYITSPLTAKK